MCFNLMCYVVNTPASANLVQHVVQYVVDVLICAYLELEEKDRRMQGGWRAPCGRVS